MRRWLSALLILLWAGPVVAQTPSGAVESCTPDAGGGGERVLCQTVVVPAPAAEVWALLSTSEGWRSWAAPVAELELRSGGRLETSYNPSAAIGDPANIRNRVLAYTPERLLVIQIADPPPGFPHPDLARQLSTALELEPLDATHTQVRATMMGFGDEPGFDQLYAFFERGNAFTLTKLRERIERGPVDWQAEHAEGAQP